MFATRFCLFIPLYSLIMMLPASMAWSQQQSGDMAAQLEQVMQQRQAEAMPSPTAPEDAMAERDADLQALETAEVEARRSAAADRAEALLARREIEAVEDYSTIFPFPLTREKMAAFTIAALEVESINARWDLMIAGAETDDQAIEFNGYTRDELATVFANISNLSIDEYQIMLERTLIDGNFAQIFSAYKDLYLANLMNERGEIDWAKLPNGERLQAALGE